MDVLETYLAGSKQKDAEAIEGGFPLDPTWGKEKMELAIVTCIPLGTCFL
jgi:hypothetical protein